MRLLETCVYVRDNEISHLLYHSVHYCTVGVVCRRLTQSLYVLVGNLVRRLGIILLWSVLL